MNSRERILEAIKKNKPAETILPADLAFDALAVNLTEKYLQVLQGIGGKGTIVDNLDELNSILSEKLSAGEQVVNGVEALGNYNISEYAGKNPGEIEMIGTTILSGTIAVAENAAIWMPEKNLGNRLLPFLCQHLIILIEEKNIVGTMHVAYDKIRVDEDGYGVFIAGPSKTADIEQSLVIGAHGPVSLEVFIG